MEFNYVSMTEFRKELRVLLNSNLDDNSLFEAIDELYERMTNHIQNVEYKYVDI